MNDDDVCFASTTDMSTLSMPKDSLERHQCIGVSMYRPCCCVPKLLKNLHRLSTSPLSSSES